jgi:hypothetical protein
MALLKAIPELISAAILYALWADPLRFGLDWFKSGVLTLLKGLPLGDASFSFGLSDTETDTELTLPVEIRNDIARLEITGEASAGAVQLLDKRWRRRSIGVVTGATLDNSQPLLASTYYLTRLNPFADVRLADRARRRKPSLNLTSACP